MPRREADMLFEDIELLIVLSEAKSLSQAADQLFMSRPGLSQRISNFEKRVGRKLFERTSTGITPTKAGGLVINFARNTASLERVLASQLAAIDERFDATLDVGMCINDGVALLPRLVAGFSRKAPDVRVHLEAGYEPQLVDQLKAGKLDFAMLENQPEEPGLELEVLGYKKLIFICPNAAPYNRTTQPISIEGSIQAIAGNVTKFTKISDDSPLYQYYAPYGVAIDKSPESDYFGRIYITNTAAGTVSAGNPSQAQTSTVGVYVLGADISDITQQGSTAYSGTISWSGETGMGPKKAAVASDGRVFLCDASPNNAGIYLMNPETFDISSIFTGATNSNGSLMIGGKYVCGQITAVGIRGEGATTQLYAIDKTASGSSWKKFINVYNIGESNTWTTAPNESKAASSYVGNDNSSIVPVSTGYWAAQYRGGGSNSPANPCMFYYSDQYQDAVFNTAEPNIIGESSQNGALAVNEKEQLIALSVNGGVAVYSYKMKEGIPSVTEKFRKEIAEMGGYVNDFEFDYAGNLYAVSNVGERLAVWAMPTSDNSCVTPAKKSLVLNNIYTGIENAVSISRISPNPTTGIITISAQNTIETVEIYNIAGSLVMRQAHVGTTTISLDLSDLAGGMYFVKVNDGKAVKVIKK